MRSSLAVTIWCEGDHDIGLQIVLGFVTIQSHDWSIRPNVNPLIGQIRKPGIVLSLSIFSFDLGIPRQKFSISGLNIRILLTRMT